MHHRYVRRTAAFGLAVLTSAAWSPQAASASQPAELPSAIVIAKSSNRNEVHYAVRVDDACAPYGPAPVRPYWRMLERGPKATEALRENELRVLGLQYQARQ
jgi:hypothetical protein